MTNLVYHSEMLWHDEPQNSLFNRIVTLLFIVAMVFSLLILTIELPALTRAEKEKLPAQLVKIIARKAAVEAIKPKAKTELVPVIEPVLETVPEPKADLPTDSTVDSTVKTKAKKIAKAKAKARRSGLLALSAELSQMHESSQAESFLVNEAYPALLVSTQQVAKAEVAEVNALSAIALTSSPTLNETVFTTRTVTSSNFDGGKTLTRQSWAIAQENLLAKTNEASAKSLARPISTVSNDQLTQSDDISNNNANDRTTESIRQVFDKNKAALYAIYRRALRQDPALKGKVTIDITIEPDGAVSMIKLVLSELDFTELENKLLARIRMINFSAQGLNSIQLKYTFNFLPF